MSIPANASSVAVAHANSNAKANTPPAKAARDYLAANPDLPEQPFGELVSRLAKGESPSSVP